MLAFVLVIPVIISQNWSIDCKTKVAEGKKTVKPNWSEEKKIVLLKDYNYFYFFFAESRK